MRRGRVGSGFGIQAPPSVGPSEGSLARSQESLAEAEEATLSAKLEDERAAEMKKLTEAALALARRSESLARE
jgi:hypothetical protein